MPLLILLLFIAVPLAEIAILVMVGQQIGLLWTILIVILTAVIGTTLLRTQGFGVMARASEALASGKMPVEPVIEGLFLLIAGAFLLTPGLLTDTVGFLMLIPLVRMAVAHWTLQKLLKAGAVHVSGFGARTHPQHESPRDGKKAPGAAPSDGPVIDGDYERVDEQTTRSSRDPRQR
ncbi:MAG: hypothetical protein APF80_15055 [Alphaproteobacteria bacterium BRH_c36]|nr:MAG: hypothetical protein APF80_15055 [Alphaproteobacteria bacterium BRH_c36]